MGESLRGMKTDLADAQPHDHHLTFLELLLGRLEEDDAREVVPPP